MCFRVLSDSVEIRFVGWSSKNIISRLDLIEQIIQDFQSYEDEFKFQNDEYWKISYNYVEPVYLWAMSSDNLQKILKNGLLII